MHPIIAKFGPITIYSYGLLVASGFIIGTFLASRQAPRFNIPPEKVINLSLVILVSGIIGGRVFYILLNLKEYRTNPLEMVMITHGGLVFYGGAIFAFLAALVYMKKAVLPLLDTLDLLVPFVALGHAIGRIGCFLNGCCFGRPACGFFGAVFQDGIPRIPTQLYSSLLLLCLFLYLKARLERRKFRGQVAYSYLMLYPAGRIFMELLRGDNAVAVSVLGMGLSFSQLVSLLLLLIGISGYMAERRKWIRTKSL